MLKGVFPLVYVPHRLIRRYELYGWEQVRSAVMPAGWSVLMRWAGRGEPQVPSHA